MSPRHLFKSKFPFVFTFVSSLLIHREAILAQNLDISSSLPTL